MRGFDLTNGQILLRIRTFEVEFTRKREHGGSIHGMSLSLTIVSSVLRDSDSLDRALRQHCDADVAPSVYDVRCKRPEHLYFGPNASEWTVEQCTRLSRYPTSRSLSSGSISCTTCANSCVYRRQLSVIASLSSGSTVAMSSRSMTNVVCSRFAKLLYSSSKRSATTERRRP